MNMSVTNTLNWYAKALRPASVSIKPKALGMPLDETVPTYWFDNNPFMTQLLTAFSAVFPLGESFMIDSVRMFRDDIKTSHPDLYKECGAFIGQEAHHSKEHQAINDFMVERGLPVSKLTYAFEWVIPLLHGLPEKDQMALTGAAEHLTALFGHLVLSNPEVIAQVDESMRPIWVWHAIEEIEHKAVTFDLFEAVDGNYVRRVYGYMLALTLLLGLSVYGTGVFMLADKENFSPQHTLKGLWWMFGAGKKAGYLRKSVPILLDYFKFDYHPWKVDDSDLIKKWRPELDRMMSEMKVISTK